MFSLAENIKKYCKHSLINSFPFLYKVQQNLRFSLTNSRGCAASRACLWLFRDIVEIEEDGVSNIIGVLDSSKETVYFVQIGSNDGKTNDPLYRYISSSTTWQGILVEPVSFLFERLKKNYADRTNLKFEKSLISNVCGNQKLYYVSSEAKDFLPDLPWWHDQIGSFSKQYIIDTLGNNALPFICEEVLPSLTLSDLFKKYHVKDLDLLHTDVEGYDYEIIKQLDTRKSAINRPLMILAEYKNLTYWQTFKLVSKLRKNCKIFATLDDILAVDFDFYQSASDRINNHLNNKTESWKFKE